MHQSLLIAFTANNIMFIFWPISPQVRVSVELTDWTIHLALKKISAQFVKNKSLTIFPLGTSFTETFKYMHKQFPSFCLFVHKLF